MKLFKFVRILLVFVVLAFVATVVLAQGVSIEQTDINVVTVFHDMEADECISIDWGDGAASDHCGTGQPWHSYTYTEEPGGYTVTVRVSGAYSSTARITICWFACEEDATAGDSGTGSSEAPASPWNYCTFANPGNIISERGRFFVEFSENALDINVPDLSNPEATNVVYHFNAHNHRDQLGGEDYAARNIVDRTTGEVIGYVWIVEHNYPDPFWRCGAYFNGDDMSVGRPQLPPVAER